MKEMSPTNLKTTKGIWVIFNKDTREFLLEDNPIDKIIKPPYLLMFNDYKRANHFIIKSEATKNSPEWVLLNISDQNLWDKLLKIMHKLRIKSTRLNTCIEDSHNCSKIIISINEYPEFTKFNKLVTKYPYDHLEKDTENSAKSQIYILDWENIYD